MKTVLKPHPAPVTGEAIRIRGLVQGVGFRPAAWRLATRLGVLGEARNDGEGVLIHAWASAAVLDEFVSALAREAPPLSRIEAVERTPLTGPPPAPGFHLRDSVQGQPQTGLLPDAVACRACLADVAERGNRRHRYAFTNCTNCGPRFTLIEALPYDRERTTLRAFTPCAACQKEYDGPGDRRFHAEPNACPDCGPQLVLQDRRGCVIKGEPIALATARLKDGGIVAVKGLGGYQLACLASDEEAVQRLRQRKRRYEKPFAVMAENLEAVRAWCEVDEREAALLASAAGPIVLLRRLPGAPVARGVAPGVSTLGMMLPTTPLHHLLLCAVGGPLVMTSGNLTDEPIAYADDEALSRLGDIADFFLTHNRRIHMRVDDSVARCFLGQTLLLRRARGYAPAPLSLPAPAPQPLLAVGGQFKNTFCLVDGRAAHLGHHIGDLIHPEALDAFARGITHYENLLGIRPKAVAHDLHPDYLSTQYALERTGVRAIAVQHHHAHIASVLAEKGVRGRVIGVAFDGTGLGADGAVWGGEFLLADIKDFTRAAHLAYTPLAGGEAAIREPWRYAAACLHRAYGRGMERLDIEFILRRGGARLSGLCEAIEKNINCPPTSSMGRLFDAAAALIGVRDTVTYEGQAAVELEELADGNVREGYPWPLDPGPLPWTLDTNVLIRAMVEDLLRGVVPATIAARFHNSVADLTLAVCQHLRDRTGIGQVALAGGVFQNMRLVSRLAGGLEGAGFTVHLPERVPVNDGGLAFGQAAVACARMAAEQEAPGAAQGGGS